MTVANPGVAAVVVVFHPEARRLGKLLDSLESDHVEAIYLVDNTPVGTEAADWTRRNLFHVRLGSNTGIAHAQNVGIECALRENFSHVMLFDQDSELPIDLVPQLLSAEAALIAAGCRVAAVGPLFTDRKSSVDVTAVRYRWWGVHKLSAEPGSHPVETDSIIASGTLVRSEVLRAVGGMIDVLFIDWVDIEWALRAKARGYHCYIVRTAHMSHSIGDRSVRVAGRHFNLHSDFRKFYIVRNALLLARLKYLSIGARFGIVLKVLFKYVPAYLLLSDNRVRTAKKLCAAIGAGLSIKAVALQPTQFLKDPQI